MSRILKVCPLINKSSKYSAFLLFSAFFTAILAFLPYIPSLSNGFVNWDDHVYIYNNKNLFLQGGELIKWAFTSTTAGQWHPLSSLFHALEVRLFGPINPFGHHFVSALLHSINTFIVFFLIYSLALRGFAANFTHNGKMPGTGINKNALITASVTAAFFAIHPLHVESVAWATERRDLLYSLFYLLSIYLYLLYTDTKGPDNSSSCGRRQVFYIASLLLFTLSLLSKSMAVTLPVVLLIIDYYPLSRFKFKGSWKENFSILIEKAPFFALALAAAAAAILAMSYGNSLVSIQETPLMERLLISVRAFSFYIYKIVLPVNLSPVYPYPLEVGLFKAEFFFALALAAIVALVSILSFKKVKLIFIAWLYFLITLLPVIGIMRIGYLMSAADRYTYLPIIGPLVLAGALTAYLLGKAAIGRRGRVAVTIAVILITLLFTVGTVKQSYIWKDSFALWNRQTALYPERSFVAYANRAEAYLDAGDPEQAIADYSIALKIRPGDVNYYADRGAAYFVAGDYKNAKKDLDTALSINPDHVDAHFRRGMLLASVGFNFEAIREYTAALTIYPEFAEAYNTRGIARQKIGNIQGAMADYLAAVENDPTFSVAHLNLARLYEKKGNNNGALRHYEAAARLGDEIAVDYLEKFKKEFSSDKLPPSGL